MRRRRLGVAIAAAGALALSGCGIDKAAEHGRQLDVIGNVELSTTFCTSGDSDGESRACAPFSFPHRGQLLVAYLLPVGSSIADTLTDSGGVRHFTWSESYTAFMRDTYPEDGMYWAAYVSEPYSTTAGQQYAFTMAPEVTLPDPGAPFAGPLRYQVVGGFRTLSAAGDDGSAPVDCIDTGSTACASTEVAEQDSLQPTRDLAVLPGAEPPVVEAGGHVAVPFDLRFAGSGGDGVAFALTSPDGTVSQQTLQPRSDSDSVATVDVAVPADAEPGEYDVSLRATAPGEDDTVIHRVRGARFHVGAPQTRTGTMTYRVVAPSPQPSSDDPPPEPPVVAPPPPQHPETPPPALVPVPVHVPVDAPRAVRARLALSLTALPRRAYSGTNVSYLMTVRNASREPVLRARTCAQLPRVVQFVRATAGVSFSGSRLCFSRRHLAAGAAAAARLVAHVDVDARPGMTRASATAGAANAGLVRARARMRVLRRACPPRHTPVTG
jgi:hypothetical protein